MIPNKVATLHSHPAVVLETLKIVDRCPSRITAALRLMRAESVRISKRTGYELCPLHGVAGEPMKSATRRHIAQMPNIRFYATAQVAAGFYLTHSDDYF